MPKNKLKVFVFLGSCIFGLWLLSIAGCFKAEIKNLDSKGKSIICFGDSVTFGYGVKPGEDFPTELARLASYPVINAGVDGDTSAVALKRLETDVLAKDPLLVLVEFSGNDFIKKLPKEVTEKSISEIIERIQERGAIVAVVDVSAGFFLSDYRAILSRIARRKGAIFIPELLKGIITDPSMKSDFLHPNASGYKILAGRIYKAILPYLKIKN